MAEQKQPLDYIGREVEREVEAVTPGPGRNDIRDSVWGRVYRDDPTASIMSLPISGDGLTASIIPRVINEVDVRTIVFEIKKAELGEKSKDDKNHVKIEAGRAAFIVDGVTSAPIKIKGRLHIDAGNNIESPQAKRVASLERYAKENVRLYLPPFPLPFPLQVTDTQENEITITSAVGADGDSEVWINIDSVGNVRCKKIASLDGDDRAH